MNYKNGYKVVYEVAANGERTFYASKSNSYPNTDDTPLATFIDAEYAGQTIYEHAGEFYAADTNVPKFDENGIPTGNKIAGFEALFVEGADASIDPEDDPEDDPNIDPEDEDE